MKNTKTLDVAFFGNPNTGKTTLFNYIAETNYHVANYPGITVESKHANITHNDFNIRIHDLPGLYSLIPYSDEEKVARNFLLETKPDLVVQVIDASNLQRNLYLTVMLMEYGVNIILALNMIDVAENKNLIIDLKLLSKNLNIPIVVTQARKAKGKNELLDTIVEYDYKLKRHNICSFSYGSDIDNLINNIINYNLEHDIIKKQDFYEKTKFKVLKYLENDNEIIDKNKGSIDHYFILDQIKKLEDHLDKTIDSNADNLIADYRYGIVNTFLKDVISINDKNKKLDITAFLDKILTQKIFGPLFLFSILYFVYNIIFWLSEYPINYLNMFFDFIKSYTNIFITNELALSLVNSAILDGVGGVFSFTPLIFFMFFIIAFLEDSGYMARMAYMLDRLFNWFGLHGNSIVPFIISGGIAGGCAVPGVMAARTIKGKKERLITILTAPFMACGAKIPIFAMLISAFFEKHKGLAMLLVILASWILALIIAKIYSKTIITGDSSFFIMELPPYRLPLLKGLFIHAWERTYLYIKKAGTIILAISILFWVFMSFPRLDEKEQNIYSNKIQKIQSLNFSEEIINQEIKKINNEKNQNALKHSIAGRIGLSMEKFTSFAGFDWKINISLLSGFAAKELVLSTLGTAYSMSETNNENSISDKLKTDANWNIGVAISLIFFTILYTPCFATIVVIVKETGTYKWGIFSMLFSTFIAFFVSTILYQVWSLI